MRLEILIQKTIGLDLMILVILIQKTIGGFYAVPFTTDLTIISLNTIDWFIDNDKEGIT